MKKIFALIIAFLMVVSFTACESENTENNATVVNPSESSETVSEKEDHQIGENEVQNSETSSEESEGTGEMTTATQVISDEKSGELPEIEGPDKFVELFSKNLIDEYYVDNIEIAPSVSVMLNVTNETIRYWESQINRSYYDLGELLGRESAEFKKIEMEQNAFKNDLKIAGDEIQSEAEEAANGSMINIEISYRLMLLYRGRAVEILCDVYNITGEVNVELITDAAG